MENITDILYAYKNDKIYFFEAVDKINDIIQNRENEIVEKYQDKINNIKKEIKQNKQNGCEHSFSGIDWIDACSGYKTCSKCDKSVYVYERD